MTRSSSFRCRTVTVSRSESHVLEKLQHLDNEQLRWTIAIDAHGGVAKGERHVQDRLQLSPEQRLALANTRRALLANVGVLLAERKQLVAQAEVCSCTAVILDSACPKPSNVNWCDLCALCPLHKTPECSKRCILVSRLSSIHLIQLGRWSLVC